MDYLLLQLAQHAAQMLSHVPIPLVQSPLLHVLQDFMLHLPPHQFALPADQIAQLALQAHAQYAMLDIILPQVPAQFV